MPCHPYAEHVHPDGTVWAACDSKHCDDIHELRVALIALDGISELIWMHQFNPDADQPLRYNGTPFPYTRWATADDLPNA